MDPQSWDLDKSKSTKPYTRFGTNSGYHFNPIERQSHSEERFLLEKSVWGPYQQDCQSYHYPGRDLRKKYRDPDPADLAGVYPHESDSGSTVDYYQFCRRTCCASDSEDELSFDEERKVMVKGVIALRNLSRYDINSQDVTVRKKGSDSGLPGWDLAVKRYRENVSKQRESKAESMQGELAGWLSQLFDGLVASAGWLARSSTAPGSKYGTVGSDTRMLLREEQKISNRRARRAERAWKETPPATFDLPAITPAADSEKASIKTQLQDDSTPVTDSYNLPIRRRKADEAIARYREIQTPSVLRFLEDYYLEAVESWDPSSKSRLEFLTDPEKRKRICVRLQIYTNDEYIRMFSLDKPTRGEPHPSTYCPLFVIASIISSFPDQKWRRKLKRIFLWCFENYPGHCVENSRIIRLYPAAQRMQNLNIQDEDDFETKVFGLFETLEAEDQDYKRKGGFYSLDSRNCSWLLPRLTEDAEGFTEIVYDESKVLVAGSP